MLTNFSALAQAQLALAQYQVPAVVLVHLEVDMVVGSLLVGHLLEDLAPLLATSVVAPITLLEIARHRP